MRTNKEIVESLKQFHKRILETNLCSEIYESEMLAVLDAIDFLEHPLLLDIDDELYEVIKYDLSSGIKYVIHYGYVSSIRKDKDGKWHFRYTYYQEGHEDPLNPTKFNKGDKINKSLHEASIDELYDGTTYVNKFYFKNLKDAQKTALELQNKLIEEKDRNESRS